MWDFILTNPQTGRILTQDELLIFVELEKFTEAMCKLHKEKKGIDHAFLTEKERLLLWGSYINNVQERTPSPLPRTHLLRQEPCAPAGDQPGKKKHRQVVDDANFLQDKPDG